MNTIIVLAFTVCLLQMLMTFYHFVTFVLLGHFYTHFAAYMYCESICCSYKIFQFVLDAIRATATNLYTYILHFGIYCCSTSAAYVTHWLVLQTRVTLTCILL